MPREKRPGYGPNLYPDNKGRDGFYRFKRMDGKFKTFQADSLEEANRLADEAATHEPEVIRGGTPARDSLAFYLPQYIAYRESIDEKLANAPRTEGSWYNRRLKMAAFARHFNGPVRRIKHQDIRAWWLNESPANQKLAHAEFRKWFNWLTLEGIVGKTQFEYNPFTSNDALPILDKKPQPSSKRERMTLELFWRLYDAAEPGLKTAMGIALVTFLRLDDVINIMLDDVVDDVLRVVISKSEKKVGRERAARREWRLAEHPLLRKLIKEARENSMANHRCPYLVSYRPQRRKLGKNKTHPCQVLKRQLCEMFDDARNAIGYTPAEGFSATSFHEIRGLANTTAKHMGHDLEALQHTNGHSDANTTKTYLDGQDLPYERVGISFTEDALGRAFD